MISMRIKTRSPWWSTCPPCHKKLGAKPMPLPLLFLFLSIYFRKKRTPPRYLHRVCSSWVGLPSDEQKWAVTKSLNWTPPRPVYTRVRTSINKPWLVAMLRPGKASGVHVYLVWQYGFQYCPICMIHPAVSTNRFTVSTRAPCVYTARVYVYTWEMGYCRNQKILDQPSSSLVSLSLPFIRLLHVFFSL